MDGVCLTAKPARRVRGTGIGKLRHGLAMFKYGICFARPLCGIVDTRLQGLCFCIFLVHDGVWGNALPIAGL